MLDYHTLRPQTVAELTHSIKGLLESSFPFVTVVGEISNLRRPYSGHCYFTLKDEHAQIRAVLFKMQERYLSAALTDGRLVFCRGRVSVYEPRGEYQLIVDTVQFQGEGALQIAFEELKKKLAGEGLFDQARKKSIPDLPGKIALITSPTGAAVRDFLNIAGRRFPLVPIVIYPVRVQGAQAADEIAAAITTLDLRERPDVIVLCRGGGSIEDLWAFNEEKVARAIAAAATPIVSAIGHEIDFTIADFVADLRAPTPSAAAEILLPDGQVMADRITFCRRRLSAAMTRQLEGHRRHLDSLRRILGDPSSLLTHFALLLDHRQQGLARAMEKNLTAKGMQLARQQSILTAMNPMAVLDRGYAIVIGAKQGRPISDSAEVAPGDGLRIRLAKGEIGAAVTEIRA